MPVNVRYYTDPACPYSWGAEPQLRRLMWEFGDGLRFSWVMGGLARAYGADYRDTESGVGSGTDPFADLMAQWLGTAADSGMPVDARLWSGNPIASTYPACQAVKAAAEQGPDGRLPVPPQAARGPHDRAQEARPHRGARRRGGARRPRRRAISNRSCVERDHRGVRGRPRPCAGATRAGPRGGEGVRDRGPRARQLSVGGLSRRGRRRARGLRSAPVRGLPRCGARGRRRSRLAPRPPAPWRRSACSAAARPASSRS